jgi:hypothetical protein
MMDPGKQAMFNVLNDWLDLPQDTFEMLWPELADAAADWFLAEAGDDLG